MNLKEKAKAFLQMAGMGDAKRAFELYIDPAFIHHNQYFKGDRQSLLVAMQESHKESPNLSVEIKYCYQDHDTVVTHSLVKKANMDIVIVHIFKFSGEKVIEMWDLGQLIDTNSPNENGPF